MYVTRRPIIKRRKFIIFNDFSIFLKFLRCLSNKRLFFRLSFNISERYDLSSCDKIFADLGKVLFNTSSIILDNDKKKIWQKNIENSMDAPEFMLCHLASTP